jgi:hydroxymethylbilane synthase
LALVSGGSLDAVVLAAAGLARLGRSEAMTHRLTADLMLPAPAQGALAVEARTVDAANSWYAGALVEIDDDATRSAVTAERSLLAALEAGCTAPVGAYATVDGEQVSLTGAVIAADGSREVRGTGSGPAAEAERIGAELAAQLIGDGAATLLSSPA